MYLWRFGVTSPINAIEHHSTANGIIVELWQFVAIKQHAIFAISNDSHIGFQYLCGKVLSEHKVYVMVEPILLAKFDVFELLLVLIVPLWN